LQNEATSNKKFGYYARILVDLDMFQFLSEFLLVERDGYAFNVNVEYERLPPFSSLCHAIGRGGIIAVHKRIHILQPKRQEKI
jgi:hypothetical protein